MLCPYCDPRTPCKRCQERALSKQVEAHASKQKQRERSEVATILAAYKKGEVSAGAAFDDIAAIFAKFRSH